MQEMEGPSLSTMYKETDSLSGLHCISQMEILHTGILQSGPCYFPVIYLFIYIMLCSVNGGSTVSVDQMNTGESTVMSVPVKLNMRSGANSITFSSGQTCEFFPFPFLPHDGSELIFTFPTQRMRPIWTRSLCTSNLSYYVSLKFGMYIV